MRAFTWGISWHLSVQLDKDVYKRGRLSDYIVMLLLLIPNKCAMRTLILCFVFFAGTTFLHAQKQFAGNPVFPGWYADPEGAIINDQCWIYPTYSAPYNKQVYFDAFSSPDMVNWTKHPRILDTAKIKWARRAMWAPAIVEKNGKYFFFFSANDIQTNSEKGGIGVAVSDNPGGPFTDYLGKPLWHRNGQHRRRYLIYNFS